jgi:hypothetical protein
MVGRTGGLEARREPSGVPGARDWRSLSEFRDLGPDLQAVRLVTELFRGRTGSDSLTESPREGEHPSMLWRPFPEKGLEDVTFEDLERLIQKQVEESLFLEYKGEWSAHQIAKTVAAFANTEGGTLIVGLRTEGRIPVEVLGLDHAGDLGESLDRLVRGAIAPRPEVRFAQVDSNQGSPSLLVEVPVGQARPYLVTRTGQVMRRTQTGTEPATREYLDRLFLEGRAGEQWARSQADARLASPTAEAALLWTVPMVEEGLSLGRGLFTQRSWERIFQLACGFPMISAHSAKQTARQSLSDTRLQVGIPDSFNQAEVFSLGAETSGIVESMWTDPDGDAGSLVAMIESALPMHKTAYIELLGFHGRVVIAMRKQWKGRLEHSQTVAFRHPQPVLADDLDDSELAASLKRQVDRSRGRWSPES